MCIRDRIYLDDLRLNASLSGPASGPALVLLHALGTNLSIWDDVVERLPQNLRILCFDQRGHGASDAPQPPYAMGALIRDAERMMDHFALKDAVVVGLSLGGMVAQGLAVKRLDLVRGLVLSNTAATVSYTHLDVYKRQSRAKARWDWRLPNRPPKRALRAPM